tara:strand:+ start:735 stop:1112 length:378 start_codon:yes stop_codon:yes gene_type:complete
MKLIKYIINLIILTGSIYFLLELSELNQTTTPDGVIEKMTIKIPFISEQVDEPYELEVWLAVLAILTTGVLLGFFIAIFQILSQKGELMSARSKLKRLQIEIDNLRNESIDEDIDIDDIEDIENR